MKTLKGTALYCGIGYGIEQMKKHLEEAASVGINALFTSLQLPEADKDQVLRDFPVMAEIAHNYGMVVEADIAEATASLFGLDMKDMAAFHRMGVDYARLDGGFGDEETVIASQNKDNVTIVLNADSLTLDERIPKLEKLGLNREQVCFCHNFYPMRYTGHPFDKTKKINDTIHNHGYRVSGFIAPQSHHRIGCSIGLPTIERHRDMNVFTAVQEAYLSGMDDVFFGDDLASVEEMKILTSADPDVVTIRIQPFDDDEITDWLLDRELKQLQGGLEMIIRSNFHNSTFPGNPDNTLSLERRRGDVTICKTSLLRYSGEIQLVRKDLPMDPDIGIIGRIIDEDLPLLDTFRCNKKFRLVRGNI